MENKRFIISIISIASFISLAFIGIYHFSQTSESQLQTQYYTSQVAALESAHGLRMAITRGDKDFVLVDVRSQKEYEDEHIVGALNVPAYQSPQTSASIEEERISQGFKEIKKQHPNKKIIIYCYSSSCLSSKKIARMLVDHGIFVKELTVGWNEWRYGWSMWNYPSEWEASSVMDYIHSGSEPGAYLGYDSFSEGCSLSEEFAC